MLALTTWTRRELRVWVGQTTDSVGSRSAAAVCAEGMTRPSTYTP